MTPSRGLSPRRSLRLAGWELKTRRKFPSSRSKSWAPIGRVKLRAAERVSHPGVGSDGQVFPRPYHTCRRGFDRDFRLCSFPIVGELAAAPTPPPRGDQVEADVAVIADFG
jgi:hypothetical protein